MTPPLLSRRVWLGGAATLALGASADAAEPAIVQPENAGAAAFIGRALEMRRRAEAGGDQPYGAVVVRDGRVVGEAPSAVVTRGDPTAHAEMEAIRDAARRLGQRHLGGAALYASSRPCPMCEAAAYWAGIGRMIHGVDLVDAGPPRLNRC